MTEPNSTSNKNLPTNELEQMDTEAPKAPCKLVCGVMSLEESWGKVAIDISEDFMSVLLLEVVKIDSNAELSARMLTSLFEKNGITHGIDNHSISKVIDEVRLNSKWSGKEVIFMGTAAGKVGPVSYTLFGENADCITKGDIWSVNGRSLSFPALQDHLKLTVPLKSTVEVKAVNKDEVIAVRQEPLVGKPGKDVCGRAVSAPDFDGLVAGDNVELIEETKFKSTSFGYLFYSANCLNVVFPIIIAEDNMTAWYVNLPQIPPIRTPTPSEIISQLNAQGVTSEISEDCIEQLCKDIANQSNVGSWHVIAKGTEPVNGEDARLDLTIKKESVSGHIRQDGSIDFREINLVQTVTKDTLIATKYPFSEGTPGCNLSGETSAAEAGKDIKVEGKENVRTEEKEDGRREFYAECEGMVKVQGPVISVDPLYRISGNVDFSTGNIDVDCSLEVSGSVCADFSVKAEKNVIIGGSVESGAAVTVKGDLIVKGGILGEKTKVIVLGNLEADFIQAANVVVKGDIFVKQYIYNATVRSVGNLVVEQGNSKRAGSITGGKTYSSNLIELAVCGSPAYVPTLLALEPAPDKLAKLNQLKKNIARCNIVITKIMRSLGLEKLNKSEVVQLLEPLPPKKRKLYVLILDKLKATIANKKELVVTIKELSHELRSSLEKMSISVSKTYHGNTIIRIGKSEFTLKEDLGPSKFTYKNKEIIVTEIVAKKDRR